MPRALRHTFPAGIYHVVSRGTGGVAIFLDSQDYERFVELLGRTATRLEWAIDAYCLVPNHYHLVVELPTPTLSKGMHRINGFYARAFNERHDRRGHLFQGRFWCAPVESDQYREAACNYVLGNAATAGLCATYEEWPWVGGRALGGPARNGHVPVPGT